jgi:hypothetical protein
MSNSLVSGYCVLAFAGLMPAGALILAQDLRFAWQGCELTRRFEIA